jgi:hypothetical protein
MCWRDRNWNFAVTVEGVGVGGGGGIIFHLTSDGSCLYLGQRKMADRMCSSVTEI